MKTVDFETVLKNALSNPKVKAEYDKELKKNIDNVVDTEEKLREDDDNSRRYDIDEKKDTNYWPENLIDDIFGFNEWYHPKFQAQVSEYFMTNPKVKEVTDIVLKSIPVREAKLIRSIYMEGKSIKEIAKQKRKTTTEIIEQYKSALRKLINPNRSRVFVPILEEIDKTIINK